MPDTDIQSNSGPELEMKRAKLPLDLQDTKEGPPRFSGYAAIFKSVDRDGDLIEAQAFAESLEKGELPALLWQHDPTKPIGKILDARVDQKGLFIQAELSSAGQGREAYDLLKLKALDGLSVGFVTKVASRDPATGVRAISKADLVEISLVTFPAHSDARVTTVKSMRPEFLLTKKAFERFLRDQGLSRREARGVVAMGFCGLQQKGNIQQEQAQIGDMVAAVKDATIKLKALGDNR